MKKLTPKNTFKQLTQTNSNHLKLSSNHKFFSNNHNVMQSTKTQKFNAFQKTPSIFLLNQSTNISMSKFSYHSSFNPKNLKLTQSQSFKAFNQKPLKFSTQFDKPLSVSNKGPFSNSFERKTWEMVLSKQAKISNTDNNEFVESLFSNYTPEEIKERLTFLENNQSSEKKQKESDSSTPLNNDNMNSLSSLIEYTLFNDEKVSTPEPTSCNTETSEVMNDSSIFPHW